MFDVRVFNALAAQTSMKIGQLSFNVTTPVGAAGGKGDRSERRHHGCGAQGARCGGRALEGPAIAAATRRRSVRLDCFRFEIGNQEDGSSGAPVSLPRCVGGDERNGTGRIARSDREGSPAQSALVALTGRLCVGRSGRLPFRAALSGSDRPLTGRPNSPIHPARPAAENKTAGDPLPARAAERRPAPRTAPLPTSPRRSKSSWRPFLGRRLTRN